MKRILICGTSVYLAAIETTLRALPDVEIIHADHFAAAESPAPFAVIVASDNDLATALALIEKYPAAHVLTLDEETHALAALTSARTIVHTTQDLIAAVLR